MDLKWYDGKEYPLQRLVEERDLLSIRYRMLYIGILGVVMGVWSVFFAMVLRML